jgi:hypothetical protein
MTSFTSTRNIRMKRGTQDPRYRRKSSKHWTGNRLGNRAAPEQPELLLIVTSDHSSEFRVTHPLRRNGTTHHMRRGCVGTRCSGLMVSAAGRGERSRKRAHVPRSQPFGTGKTRVSWTPRGISRTGPATTNRSGGVTGDDLPGVGLGLSGTNSNLTCFVTRISMRLI